MFIGCVDSFYFHIQRLVFDPNSYELTVITSEICFVTISCCVPHIYSFLIWSRWKKCIFVIILYMMSTCIHLYLTFLICLMRCREFTHMVIIAVCCYCPVCVPIIANIISSVHLSVHIQDNNNKLLLLPYV